MRSDQNKVFFNIIFIISLSSISVLGAVGLFWSKNVIGLKKIRYQHHNYQKKEKQGLKKLS